jgi:hypothetical protein
MIKELKKFGIKCLRSYDNNLINCGMIYKMLQSVKINILENIKK